MTANRPPHTAHERIALLVGRARARLDETRRLSNTLARRLALLERVRRGELPYFVARTRHTPSAGR